MTVRRGDLWVPEHRGLMGVASRRAAPRLRGMRHVAPSSGGFPSELVVNKGAGDYVVGEDWQGMSQGDVLALSQFGIGADSGGCFAGGLSAHLSVVADPVVVQCVNLHYPTCSSMLYITHTANFGVDQTRVWFSKLYNWGNTYTTVGANPGGANSHKHPFLVYRGANSRIEWEFSNTNQYVKGFDVRHTDGGNTKYGFTEDSGFYAGQVAWTNANTGGVGFREWFDEEWWQYVDYYEILDENLGAVLNGGESRLAQFKRQYSVNGVRDPQPWQWSASKIDFTENPLSPGNGEIVPRIRAACLFNNRNKSVDTAFDIRVGPFLVSNAADPLGLKAQFGL